MADTETKPKGKPRRWQEFAGQEATLEEDGRTFAAVQEERGG